MELKPIIQMNHDLSNIVQILIAIADEEPVDQRKLQNCLEKISYLLKIYSGIYSDGQLEDVLELIEECNGHPIEVENNAKEIPFFIKRIILLECLWSNSEAKVIISEGQVTLETEYKPQRMKKEIIDELIVKNNITLEEGNGEIQIKW